MEAAGLNFIVNPNSLEQAYMNIDNTAKEHRDEFDRMVPKT